MVDDAEWMLPALENLTGLVKDGPSSGVWQYFVAGARGGMATLRRAPVPLATLGVAMFDQHGAPFLRSVWTGDKGGGHFDSLAISAA